MKFFCVSAVFEYGLVPWASSLLLVAGGKSPGRSESTVCLLKAPRYLDQLLKTRQSAHKMPGEAGGLEGLGVPRSLKFDLV